MKSTSHMEMTNWI